MEVDMKMCLYLALCVVMPAVMLLIGLRYLYLWRFRGNSQRHLSSQHLVQPSGSSVFTTNTKENFYGTNVTMGCPILGDPALTAEAKVRNYIASIPMPPSRPATTLVALEIEDGLLEWRNVPTPTK